MRRGPPNEITAALHPPFTAVHSVMQHWGPPGAAFQPPTGILVNVAKLRARRDTEADGEREKEKNREKAPVAASLVFPSPVGVEDL